MRCTIMYIAIAGCLISAAKAEFFPIGSYSSMIHNNLDSLSQVKECNFNTYRFGSYNNTMEPITCMEGENDGDKFGRSVSGGDFNGDGYSDVIVGAKWWNGAAENYIGRVYIFLGGPNMDSVPDLVLTGENAHDCFGFSVANAGDLNGDSIVDWVIGAPGYDDGKGRVYIYYGGYPLDSVADIITITGENSDDDLGWFVSSAGDVNGDGYDDIIVSAAAGGSYEWIFYAGENMDSVPDWKVTFGTSIVAVSTAGDVNGDGYDDVVMSARTSASTSELRIYFGGPDMDTIADIRYNPPYSIHTCASTAGDVNNDGYSDVLAGIEGLVYLFFGEEEMDSIPDLVFEEWQRGSSVGCAGDVNNDGYDDIIIGVGQAHWGDGEVKVFLGSNDINNFPDIILYGASIGHFGDAVSTAGDINGDGYDDIIVGEPRYFVMSDQGKVYVFAGDNSIIEGVEELVREEIVDLEVKPNPFRQTTNFTYHSLLDNRRVVVSIYNIMGRRVRTLVDGNQEMGYHSLGWDGKDERGEKLSTGVYFCELRYGNYRRVTKVTLIR